MDKGIRRFFALLLLFAFLFGSAGASGLTELRDTFFAESFSAKEMTLTAEILKRPELSVERAESLNRLMKHIVFRIRTDGSVLEISLEADGIPGPSVTVFEEDGKTLYAFSADPDHLFCYPEGKSFFSDPSTDMLERIGECEQVILLLDEFYSCFSRMYLDTAQTASRSKIQTKFRDYGTAVQRSALSFTDEAFRELTGRLNEGETDWPRAAGFLSGFVFSGRQRFTFLADENDRLMKVNYTGVAGESEDHLRNVNLDWKCLRGDVSLSDTLTLTTPVTRGSDRDNYTVRREWSFAPDAPERLECHIEKDRVRERVRMRTQTDILLESEQENVTGSITESVISGSEKSSSAVSLSMCQEGPEEYKGTLEFTHELDKIETEHLRFVFSVSSCDPLPVSRREIITAEGDAEKTLTDRMSAELLRMLIHLPQEDLDYLLKDLPATATDLILAD